MNVARNETDVEPPDGTTIDAVRRARQLLLAQALARLGSWEWDTISGRFVVCPELTRILGLPADEAPTTFEQFLKLLHPDDVDCLRRALAAALERGTPLDCLSRLPRADGVRWLHSRGEISRDALGRPRAVVSIVQDVTERLETEARMLERVRTVDARAQFLAGMSHELRTPLNAIASCAELLAMGVAGPLTGPQRELVQRIQRNQQRLLGLINDVLNFTRLSGAQLALHLRPVAVAPLVAGLEPLIAAQLEQRQLVYIMLPVPENLMALADAERLEQVVLSLLSNAIKFTPPGGSIRVACGGDEQYVRIAVEDSGRGIPGSEHAAIFEPFVQLDPDPGRQNAGAGLGLALARALTRAMGGEIEVVSERGRGSRFTVRLQRAGTDAAGSAAPNAASALTADDALLPSAQRSGSRVTRT